MSAHPIMAQALQPFAPPETEAQRFMRLMELLRKSREDNASLLRLPFQVEVKTAEATRLAEAQYALVTIDEDLVREAADWLIDKHIDELERKALELQRARWDEQREDV
jgi:hypothetical protein